VTLSRKGAKSPTRGRKLHLTGTKARVARTRQTRADLEQQLKACRREIAHARERLVEAMKQQTATSGVLRIISSSPAEIQPVLDAVAENAARLCDANNAVIFRLEDNLLRLVASYGKIPTTSRARKAVPANRDTVIGRATCDRRTIHVHDLAAQDSEYPVGSRDAKREGHRTTLATPLLREGTPIGVILIRRMEIRPFRDKQIALLETPSAFDTSPRALRRNAIPIASLAVIAVALTTAAVAFLGWLSLSETYALKYWWCSPPRTGTASVQPMVWTARGIGASLCSDRCVRASL
jgi:hypothetical protein